MPSPQTSLVQALEPYLEDLSGICPIPAMFLAEPTAQYADPVWVSAFETPLQKEWPGDRYPEAVAAEISRILSGVSQ